MAGQERSELANEEQLAILRQGGVAWSVWRVMTNPTVIDFEGADLSGADLSQANLSDANLRHCMLYRANFLLADLSRADLEGANLAQANFIGTVMTRANCKMSTVRMARFESADLTGTDLMYAEIGGTSFVNCGSLGGAHNLDAAHYIGPCSIDIPTLRLSVGAIPDAFLQGAGFNRDEIDTFRKLYATKSYFSCFISYAHADDDFASRLHSDLQSRGISCWKDKIDLKGGEYWQPQINDAIRTKDKVVLICSEKSLARPQVVREIMEAINLQKVDSHLKLYPIRIDDHIFSEEFAKFAKEQVAIREWEANWLTKVRAIQIPDFSRWKEPDQFARSMVKLVADLKKGGSG